jgi:hypothetical protein
VKFINENTHWHGTGVISNFLKRLLHAVLGSASAIMLTIFFLKIFSHCCTSYCKNYAILYYRLKTGARN